MATTIVLGSTFQAPFTGDGVYAGYVYDKLDSWYDVNSTVDTDDRPNAVGSFGPGIIYANELAISIEGQWFNPLGQTRAAAIQAHEDLNALFNEGSPVPMVVTDDLRKTSRTVYVKDIKHPWDRDDHFSFTIDAVAPDPRRYSDPVMTSATLGTSGTGLALPSQVGPPKIGLVYPITFGSLPLGSQQTITNPGNATAPIVFTAAEGEILAGFDIVRVDTGDHLTYGGPLTAGTTVVLDTAVEMAFINGVNPAGRNVISPQWITVPPRSNIAVQFLARGPVSAGTPKLYASISPAFY